MIFTSVNNTYSQVQCGVGLTEVVITINTDNYPLETSWFLIDEYGSGWTNVPLTSSDANSQLTWNLCVPDTNCYTFTILDSYGDGICCAYGSGSYSVTYNGVNIASGGSFLFSEETCGIGLCSPDCQIVIPNNVQENLSEKKQVELKHYFRSGKAKKYSY